MFQSPALKTNKQATLLAIVLGALALCYVTYKAAAASFTHDESFTYTRYVNKSFWDIITYNTSDVIPNNHILNTLLMKIFQYVLGSSELALRLPNVLAYAAFLFFSIRWLRRFNKPWLLVTGVIALHFNPYMLDFFALARGYGLSMSFLFISFYFFYNYVHSEARTDLALAFTFAALAVWSSFILLNYYLALLFVFNVFLFLKYLKDERPFSDKAKRFLSSNTVPLIVTVILGIVIFQSLRTISGDLFGPSDGFWSNTVRTLAYCSTNTQMGMQVDYICEFIALVMILSAIAFLYQFYKNRFNIKQSADLLSLLLLLASAGMTILQHVLLQVPFLENRTGLFFLVLFNISFIWLVYYLSQQKRLVYLSVMLAGLYSVFLSYNVIVNSSLHSHITWEYDSHTEEMLETLESDYKTQAKPGAPISLGITWLFEPTINFYRQTKKLDWLKEVNRDGYTGSFDYYYVEKDSAFIDTTKKVVMKSFDDIQTILARNP